MLGLLLTERSEAEKKGEELKHDLHETVELLLEEYSRQLSTVRHEIGYLLKKVQSKTDFLSITLDAYRNRIITIDIYLGIVGIGLGFGTATAGFFGSELNDRLFLYALLSSDTAFFLFFELNLWF